MAGIGKVTLTNQDLRENFKVAAMMIAHANNVPIERVDLNELVQGYVLSMINATVGQSQLQFPITNTDLGSIVGAPVIPMMRIVNQVDSFVAGKLGYYLLLYQFQSGNQANPDYTNVARMQPITYPNPYVNNSFFGEDLAPGNILFWHGNISIEVNGIKLYKAWECLQHLYVPYVQATPTSAVARSGANPWDLSSTGLTNVLSWQPNVQSAYDGANDAFFPMEPLPVFSGSKQSIVNLNLPANIPGTIAPFNNTPAYGTTYILKICLHLRGVLAQNSTSLK